MLKNVHTVIQKYTYYLAFAAAGIIAVLAYSIWPNSDSRITMLNKNSLGTYKSGQCINIASEATTNENPNKKFFISCGGFFE